MAITPAIFLKEVKDELKKVTWPTRSEVIRLTAVVIIISFIVGFFLGILDFILVNITKLLLK